MTEILPHDLQEFLGKKKKLEYDVEECVAGKIALKRLDKLCIEPIYVDSENSPLEELDPNAGKRGYYAIPAVSLLSKCQGFDPEGILVWLPDQLSYGTWDNDHWDVLVFPDVTWTDIVRDPVPFINAQWKHGVPLEYLAPWDRYQFKEGRPWDVV
jgi:hypothetical protein